ncbi:hypothetical protein FCM35_KLT14009 [Carex littledalei]|uniref:Uncharacterized protein n=1 Tax=Carex littledalei TaxID=544730 RepID=A0A833VFT1_9POAL|nr:hypothetical protein FCM35_KLT14009 [Carex littledalei]
MPHEVSIKGNIGSGTANQAPIILQLMIGRAAELIFSPNFFSSFHLIPTQMSPSNTEIKSDTSGEVDPPAESYRLPFGAEIDWIGLHKVYERDESVKETTNPKSHSHLHNSKNVGSNSQRFSGNLKPGIIGLPGNIQNSSILGHSARRPSCVRMIPQKNSSGGKLSALEAEPGSPKVSCMGKVLSEKPKGPSQLRRKSKAKKAPRSASKKSPAKTEHKGPGCLFRMARILCGSKKRAMDVADESIRLENGGDFSVSARISFGKDIKMKGRTSFERDVDAKETVIIENERDTPVPVPVPGIGGIKRFASGRKVEWNFETETGNFNEAKEGKSLEKDADVKERSTSDNEKDTPVPVFVLGLGGLKRFASGRKVDWNYETETDGGNFVKEESNENNKLENDDVKKRNSLEKENDTSVAVPVLGIMKKFTSGRKLDWNFEVEDGGCMAKEEAKESNTLEKSDDNKEMNTFEKEIGTQLPVPVLGIGMMRRFPSGRKVEWSFGVDTDKGCITKEEGKEMKTLKKDDDVKEKDPLVAVSVPEIGEMKRFASGRKVDWDFETEAQNTTEVKEMKTSKKDDDVKVTNTMEKENDTAVVVSLPRIGSMKRFASGRKVDWNFEVEFDNADEAKKNDTLQKNNVDATENNVLKKEADTPVTVTPSGIGGMRKFKSGRKLDRTFEVKGARQKSGMK